MPARFDAWVFAAIVASAAAVLVSIAAAQILLTLALLGWAIWKPRPIRAPPYILPLTAFAATTLVSLALSPEPELGFGPVRKFVLFAMAFAVCSYVSTTRRAIVASSVLLVAGAAAAVVALFQFAVAYNRFQTSGLLADDPTVLARITGLMGHWMTFSGEQLLVWCAAVPAVHALGTKRSLVPLTLVGTALILSFTRSVWIGAAAGTAVAALSLNRRQLAWVLIPTLAVGASASGLILHRISRSMESDFAPDTGRLALLKAGAGMVVDHPLFGVGPERIRREFRNYYTGPEPEFFYGHLHNNYVQIAAERGLLSLAAFVWLVVSIFISLTRIARTAEPLHRWAAFSALAALTGFVVAGMFEYNFGDSEVLMLMLFVTSVPFGLSANTPEWKEGVR